MIFFDIDGTLLDFKRSEYLGAAALYNEYKREIGVDEDAFCESWRMTADKYFHKYLAGEMTFFEQRIKRVREVFSLSGVTLSDGEAKARFDVYTKNYETSWQPFADVIPCLKDLSEYRLGIITNGDFSQQTLKLERLGIKSYFEIIVASGEAGVAKPDAGIFNTACGRANELPQSCWYIGDNLATDILPCREAGMHGIWLSRDNEEVNFPDITVIDTLKDLKAILPGTDAK